MNSNNLRERYFKGRVYIAGITRRPEQISAVIDILVCCFVLPVAIFGPNQKLLFRSSLKILHLGWL